MCNESAGAFYTIFRCKNSWDAGKKEKKWDWWKEAETRIGQSPNQLLLPPVMPTMLSGYL